MPDASAVLTGLSLVTGIAREATDGVPIVKQVLGVASRIVGLAEQIDKSRDDLHALAERAKKMELTIATVVGDREPEERLLRSLDEMNGVLRAVEKHFDKHIRQSRVRKTFGFVFTVRKEVDRLRGEFDDRLRELEVAATLDANITAKRNARFIGEFRNIRHSEIDLLRRITPPDRSRQGYKINCHLATCEGSNQLVVVREIVECGQDEQARRRIEEHDDVLERLSLVSNRHPNIAYLYGRNAGPKDSRFVVLKAGDIRSIHDLFGARKAEISVIGQIIAKLVDALCHLQKHGASCSLLLTGNTNIYIDKNCEPKIGVQDDLYTFYDSPEVRAQLTNMAVQLILACYSAPRRSQENEFPCAHLKHAAWIPDVCGTLIEAGYRGRFEEIVFRRADIGSLIPLSPESQMYLRQSNSRRTDGAHDWDNTLLDMAVVGREDDGSFLYAEYYSSICLEEHGYVCVYCVKYTVDAVYHNTIYFEFPGSAANDIRDQLGIPASEDDQDVRFYLQRFPGTCTGWRPGFLFRQWL